MGRLESGIVTRKDADKKDDENDKNKALKKEYLCTVKVRREGDAVVPVDILVKFKDGSTERRTWDGEYRWVKYTWLRNSEIESVQVDPGTKYRLDVNFSNNSWQKEYQINLSTHWSASILFWLQNALLCLTAIA
jgi:hypothetical protein